VADNLSMSAHKEGNSFSRISPGTLLFERYQVLKLLGCGSSGTVFSCSDLELGNLKVALKIFPSFIAQNKNAAARLHREIVVGYQINHHHVVRLYDCVRNEEMIGLAMEHVEGDHLESIIKAETTLELDWIKVALIQCCKGLEAIHKAGLLHRDLKPSNILLSDHQQIKITDFGVVGVLLDVHRETNRHEGKLEIPRQITSAGDVVGTLDYLSPEYLEFGRADEQSDIFSLGLVGYELITGFLPFASLPVPDLIKAKITLDTPPLTSLPEDHKELGYIIAKAAARNPHDRFRSAEDMRLALEQIAMGGTPGVSTTYQSNEKVEVENASKFQLPLIAFVLPLLLVCGLIGITAFPQADYRPIYSPAPTMLESVREVLREKRDDILRFFTR